MSFFETLKQRWGLNSLKDVIIILIVFACTGMSSLYIKKPIFDAIGLRNIEPYFLRGLLYTIILLIIYNILLLVFGFLFGKGTFFLNFEKRFFKRLFGWIRISKK